MHELSIVQSVVSSVVDALPGLGHPQVLSVKLRVGELSGVVEASLQFCYEAATAGTVLEGSKLEVEHVPAAIYCPKCDAVVDLPGIQSFRCPQCNQPSGDLRRGRELDIESLQIEESVND